MANKSNHPKHKHAALIFHNGELIAWSNNQGNSHAEWRAIQIAKIHGYKEGLVLLSIAINKKGELKLAKPCKACQYYIGTCKMIKTVLYSTSKQTIVRL